MSYKTSFANGASLGETQQLIRSIKVELTSGSAIRAYDLKYVTSSSTGRTLLDSVQMYGKDVAIDAQGVISGGTNLPEESFDYLSDPQDRELTGGSSWSSVCSMGSHFDVKGTGDFDGNGFQDFYCHDVLESGQVRVGLSDGSAFTASDWGQFCGNPNAVLSTGDFDGNGKTDFLCKDNAGVASVALSTGSGFTTSAWTGVWCTIAGGVMIPGDFNSDGMTDIGCHDTKSSAPSFNVDVRLSNGSSFDTESIWLSNWCRWDGGSSWGESWGPDR